MKEYIYRIHLKPQNDKKENPFKFCKQKSIVGIGWPLDEKKLEKFKKEKALKRTFFLESIKEATWVFLPISIPK